MGNCSYYLFLILFTFSRRYANVEFMKLDIESIKKFKNYRDKGLSYREIEKLIGKELKTLTRYNKYILAGYLEVGSGKKLSTD